MLVASYQGMLKWYKRFAPLQDKILKYMEFAREEVSTTEREIEKNIYLKREKKLSRGRLLQIADLMHALHVEYVSSY